jgi:hypothetical protein
MKKIDYDKATEFMDPSQRAFYDILLKMLDILEKAAGTGEYAEN